MNENKNLVSHQNTLPSVDVVINSDPLLADNHDNLETGALCDLSAVELNAGSPDFKISPILKK